MNTTRAMLVIGILMLALAVIVAQGLRPDEPPTTSGPVISGSVSHTPKSPEDLANENGTEDLITPLDTGTLRMDSTTPPVDVSSVPPTVQSSQPPKESEVQAPQVKVPEKDKAAEPAKSVAKPVQKPQPPKPKNLIVTTSSPKQLAPGQKAIARTRLEISSRSATFRMTGAENLKGKAFVLKEPDRVVVDLDGPWGINLAKTPNNTLIKSVRAGNQEANTRLVFDLHRAPKSFKLVQVAPKTLELQIQ